MSRPTIVRDGQFAKAVEKVKEVDPGIASGLAFANPRNPHILPDAHASDTLHLDKCGNLRFDAYFSPRAQL